MENDMKKVYKKWLMIFLIILSFWGSVVKAAVPSEMVFKPGTIRLHGSTYLGPGSSNDVWVKQSVDGHFAYCIEIHKNWFEMENMTYKFIGNGDPKIAYVLENGYPNKSITGDNNRDYYITGLAVWYLVSPNDSWFSEQNINMTSGTYNGTSSTTVIEANKLVTAAKNHTSYVNPSIDSINNLDIKFVLSNDKKYYITNKAIGINTKGNVGNYAVSLSGAPDGTIVTDANGTAKNTFSANNGFLIKVPISSISKLSYTIGISVSATGSIYKAYNYDFESSIYDLQAVTVGFAETVPVSKSANIVLNVETSVEISKVDATDSKELPGAHLVVKDSKGEVKDEWVSSDTPHSIKNLVPGKYTLTETIAPEGYKKSSETITFEVKADGVVVKKVMKNSPNIVEISKQDATTGKELPGATLVIKDSEGNTKDEWESSDVPHSIKLSPGKYTLTETIAPKGYKKSSETIEFIVEEDGTVKESVIMKNEPIEPEQVPTGDVLIYFAWLIGIGAIGYSIYHFNNLKKESLVK